MHLTKSQLHEIYSDPEFEKYYQNLEREQLTLAEVQGKQDGLINVPSSKNHFWVQIVKPLKSVIQKALDFNYSKFQPVSEVAVMQNTRNTADEKVHELTKENTEVSKKIALLTQEQKNLKEKVKPGVSSWKRRIIPSAFGIIEGYLVFDMFSASSLSFFICLLWGFLAAIVSGVGLHLAANYIAKSKTLRQAKLRTAIILLISFIVSGALGIWRAKSYSASSAINSQVDLNNEAVTNSGFSAWPFIIFSFAAFVVGLFLELKYWISEEEKKNLKKYEEKTIELRKAEHAQQALQDDIDRVKIQSAIDSALVMRKQEYACGNEQRLISLARQVVNTYESTNVEFRKDRQCPDYFGEHIDFGFKLYFIPLFNAIKQKQ